MRTVVEQLMAVVDTLTKPHTVIVDDRQGRFLGSREENPLLIKLAASTASNQGGSGGTGAAGRERVPINVGAADLLGRISKQVRAWLEELTTPAGRQRVDVELHQWAIRYLGHYREDHVPEDAVWERIRELNAWVTQIRDLLDPPFRFPLTAPCPACGQSWVNRYSDDSGELERVRALNAVERESADDSYVLCKGCDRVWRGAMQARQLRIEIDGANLGESLAI